MPYATIVIPTHNRPSTLSASVRSAQRQTVADIEILIVGDGVDQETRTIAQSLSSQDQRIRFIDNPKADRSGILHRHNAVLSAAAPRIFYNDDDDLLLPSHVEKLGSALDTHEFAESLPASVTHDGEIEVALANHSSDLLRKDLAERRVKMTYDTHIAHTKRAYLELGSPWLSSEGDLAWSFLEKFAASSRVRWSTVGEVTALSFHGAARQTYSREQRYSELAKFETLLGSLDRSRFRFGWYLQFLKRKGSLLWRSDRDETMSLLGFTLNSDHIGDSTRLFLHLTPQQLEATEMVFQFYRGAPLPSSSIGSLLIQLSQSVQGGPPFCHDIVPIASQSNGDQDCLDSLLSLTKLKPYESELCAYLLFFFCYRIGNPTRALQALNDLSPSSCFHEGYRERLLRASATWR